MPELRNDELALALVESSEKSPLLNDPHTESSEKSSESVGVNVNARRESFVPGEMLALGDASVLVCIPTTPDVGNRRAIHAMPALGRDHQNGGDPGRPRNSYPRAVTAAPVWFPPGHLT